MIPIIKETERDERGRIISPAVGLCPCGQEVELGGFTNTCDNCGTDYNWAGQALAPRECWGEETGEHWTDLIDL